MRTGILALAMVSVLTFQAPSAEALSCLPLDMYLESVVNDGTTQIFIGTATAVKDNTQVVTVKRALQGWVASEVWVEHPWSQDWQYFCSNGPAAPGKETVFLTTVNEQGMYMVTQTLAANSDLAKGLIATLEKVGVEGSITEATPAERANEVRQAIIELIKRITGMLAELKYWESRS
jgi:hypothetical protein